MTFATFRADLPWLHADRATAWMRVLAAVSLAMAVGWMALSRHGLDLTGKPLGTDFISFWSAGRLVLDGAPAEAAYDPARHGAVQTAAFHGADVGYTPFPYPPTFLLACLPLGLLPYFPALAAWMGATGFAYWRVARAWMGVRQGIALPVLAFPGVLINLANGQNAFLTTALMGGGAWLLPRRPFVAGVCLGLLAIKPHLGVLIPIALVAARQWRAIAGAALGFVGLCLASIAAFGPDAWLALPDQLGVQRQILDTGALAFGKVQTVYGALRLWGAAPSPAYAAQIATGLFAAATLAVVAWRRPASPALGAVLVAATLLVSPYMLDYDLVLAAIPLAWLFSRAREDGFRAWEKPVMLAAFILPLVARSLGLAAHVPASPFVLAALLALTVRRALETDVKAA